MTETITIPLNKLLAWEGNVRKTDVDKGLDELAASIAAHGLLQSLVVRKGRRGKYAVVAGHRRLLALISLAEAGTIEADRAVPCHVLDDNADATEVSLAENVQREAMHPADEFDAFKALIDSGVPIADVAARFGVTDSVVEKRLKLARVSPVLLAAYRDGEITLQHVMAFTVSDDHAAQECVWNELPDWQKGNPEAIRDMLTEHEVTAKDRRVKFVTLKAYEKAGGTVRRDLFSDGDHGVFIDDVALLESLVAKKLEKAAQLLRKEGWRWVEIRASFDHKEWSKYQRRHAVSVPLGPVEEAELGQVHAEYEALWQMEELDDDQQARLDAVTDRVMELENRPPEWPPETLALAGAVVTLGFDGEADFHRGLVKPEDAPKRRSEGKEGGAEVSGKSPFSPSLIESLTAHRSAALNTTLILSLDVAFAATVHAMASQVFYNTRSDLALQITAKPVSLHRVEGSAASKAIAEAGDKWSERIPGDPGDLFGWCLAQPQEQLMELLAFCVAQTVNAVVLKSDRDSASRMHHAALLAGAVKLEMAGWFAPTAESYFGRISKAQIIDALREVKGAVAPAWTGMQKSELAALAEREVALTGWLPEPLRAPALALAA